MLVQGAPEGLRRGVGGARGADVGQRDLELPQGVVRVEAVLVPHLDQKHGRTRGAPRNPLEREPLAPHRLQCLGPHARPLHRALEETGAASLPVPLAHAQGAVRVALPVGVRCEEPLGPEDVHVEPSPGVRVEEAAQAELAAISGLGGLGGLERCPAQRGALPREADGAHRDADLADVGAPLVSHLDGQHGCHVQGIGQRLALQPDQGGAPPARPRPRPSPAPASRRRRLGPRHLPPVQRGRRDHGRGARGQPPRGEDADPQPPAARAQASPVPRHDQVPLLVVSRLPRVEAPVPVLQDLEVGARARP